MAELRVDVKRRLGEEELAAVSTLLHLAAVADNHRPLGEHRYLDLAHGGRRGYSGLVAWEQGHSHPVGYAQVSRGRSSWSVDLVVDPHHRGPGSTVGADLLGAALREIAAEGGGHVHLWVPKPRPEQDAMAAANGLQRGRDLLQMRRHLEVLAKGDGLQTRPFRRGMDEQAWLELNNRAFAWHPEQGGWEMETLAEREAEPWFDPEGFLLHERDGRLAGFCWTKVHEDLTPPLGEIYVIAVDPDLQGEGLGRRLVEAGLAYLAGLGLTEAMLYVDSTNLPAVALYKHLGFRVDHVDRAYVGDVAPASG